MKDHKYRLYTGLFNQAVGRLKRRKNTKDKIVGSMITYDTSWSVLEGYKETMRLIIFCTEDRRVYIETGYDVLIPVRLFGGEVVRNLSVENVTNWLEFEILREFDIKRVVIEKLT